MPSITFNIKTDGNMKHYSLLLLLCAALGASATPNVTVTPLGDDYEPVNTVKRAPTATADVLVTEDFSLMTAGTITAPDLDNMLANYYGDTNIPLEYTTEGQWTGNQVYSAGGSVALRTLDPANGAYICTPRMDYSGSVTVSFKARYLRVQWEEDGKKLQWSGSGVMVGIGNDRESVFNTSDGEIQGEYPWLSNVRLYQNQGWCKITVEFDNYSAYNDAYIMLYSTDGVLIDDLEVTSSADNFLAAPVFTDVTDVTETGFTINFERVRKAYDTYVYLLELAGYDEQGEPKYDITYPQDEIDAMLKQYEDWSGMSITWEEYRQMMGMSLDSPYSNMDIVELKDAPSYTVSGLDPAKDYYFGLRSHYLKTYSDLVVVPITQIAAPKVELATDITKDSFTANWQPIVKAESYEVMLYGVNEAKEDEPYFIVFEDDFANTEAFTEATSIYSPDWVGRAEGILLDDLTDVPGWTSSERQWPIVQGMLGCMYWGAWLRTPDFYVGSDDEVTVNLSVKSDDTLPLNLHFAGVTYELPMNEGKFEGELTLPTNGLSETWLRLACSEDFTFFIDYITVTQNMKKGDRTYTYLGTYPSETNSLAVKELDAERFDMYGYSVCAVRGEGKKQVKSENSERMLVDIVNKSTFSRVDNALAEEAVEVERYTLDGCRIDSPRKGINIIRYSDGSVKKVMVK